jgi:hypothetical protein
MPVLRMNRSAVHLVDRHHRIDLTSAFILILLFTGCVARNRLPTPESAQAQFSNQEHQPQAQSDSDFEAAQTQKLL